jgi:hypothetical protein
MPSRFIVPAEMSLSMSMPDLSVSMPSRLIVLEEMSLSMPDVDSIPIVVSDMSLSFVMSAISMPIELNEMSMSNINPELSMPLEVNELSMSMELVPAIEQNDVVITTDDRDSNNTEPSWEGPFVVFAGSLGSGDDDNDGYTEAINSSRTSLSQICTFLAVTLSAVIMIGGYW